jgi:hypothetical protein
VSRLKFPSLRTPDPASPNNPSQGNPLRPAATGMDNIMLQVGHIFVHIGQIDFNHIPWSQDSGVLRSFSKLETPDVMLSSTLLTSSPTGFWMFDVRRSMLRVRCSLVWIPSVLEKNDPAPAGCYENLSCIPSRRRLLRRRRPSSSISGPFSTTRTRQTDRPRPRVRVGNYFARTRALLAVLAVNGSRLPGRLGRVAAFPAIRPGACGGLRALPAELFA